MSENKNKLYVGNLSYQVAEEALNNFFEENGVSVETVTIIKDKYTDRSKGFGFVEVAASQDVEKAIEIMNGKELDGRSLMVNQARARESRDSFSGSRGDRGSRPNNSWKR